MFAFELLYAFKQILVHLQFLLCNLLRRLEILLHIVRFITDHGLLQTGDYFAFHSDQLRLSFHTLQVVIEHVFFVDEPLISHLLAVFRTSLFFALCDDGGGAASRSLPTRLFSRGDVRPTPTHGVAVHCWLLDFRLRPTEVMSGGARRSDNNI